jgi:polysaccharide biosynthesis protein PelA
VLGRTDKARSPRHRTDPNALPHMPTKFAVDLNRAEPVSLNSSAEHDRRALPHVAARSGFLPYRSKTSAGHDRSLDNGGRHFAIGKLVGALLPLCVFLLGCAMGRPPMPSTAFFYGTPVPIAGLSHFERVVIEADNLDDLGALRSAGAEVFAYLSVGEAEGWRDSSRALPPELFLGENDPWKSRISDLTNPHWRAYVLETRMARLWANGYRGFFLDTLDSYKLVAKTSEEQLAQSNALIGLIVEMHLRYPGVRLLFNRGFDLLPEVGHLAVGLVAESLFESWNAETREYVPVSEHDRRWLLVRLTEARLRYDLPITVIDYVPAHKPELAKATMRRIEALGFTSWVANPGLDMLAIGSAPK